MTVIHTALGKGVVWFLRLISSHAYAGGHLLDHRSDILYIGLAKVCPVSLLSSEYDSNLLYFKIL